MKFFDSHAHLDLKGVTEKEVNGILQRAFDNDLAGLIGVAGSTEVGEYEKTLNMAAGDPRIFATVGIHPHTASFASHGALDKMRFALDHHRVVAVGEIGLDYHYNHSTPAEQRTAFIAQIRMAHQCPKPIVVHTREAEEDTIAILRDEGGSELGGVIHCFSAGKRLAEEALDLGFYLSFSGIVTFPKATEVQDVARAAPEDRILSETDSPFLSPAPKRGQTNEPANVRYVVEKLADIRGVGTDEMAEVILNNTIDCFGIQLEN